ncbi:MULTISPECIES: hypothetical protein [Clostridium]|uniref:hypothetical protein n=1 Tax=Clostridium TaxID=1485 RepID=UPI0013FB916A|nr:MULTISPECIES: hypothetical protein [Clostridium]MBY7024001.1 hypothetical protein [Clostridium botulinum]NFO30132.1 hypothetical protein [Clostridium botulinum]NFO45897.1 hypothetical protein [Clostridium botulinum]NFO53045.1 hypothetical protein [Clostridium botulinum]
MSFCNNEEIDRIISPKNASDFLLQERANVVADNMRYLRVYMNKARLSPNWSFEKSFSNNHYLKVVKNLTLDDKQNCKSIVYGDMFSNDVNGYAIKDPKWGRIICLNESLQFFMKFCNLALLDFNHHIPKRIRINALRIAIRIMLKQEAMDFFMDPRGIVPEEVGIKIHDPIKYELQYIAGHEFAHHLCGHLGDGNICERMILSVKDIEYFRPVYNVAQNQEFEADISSINRPQYSKDEYSNILRGALIWFISLDLSEAAQESISPTSSFSIKTHPSAHDRFEYLLKNTKIPNAFDMKEIHKIQDNAKWLKEVLADDISLNYDQYDIYGSAYLDEPNTEWRGKKLIDRVDYY